MIIPSKIQYLVYTFPLSRLPHDLLIAQNPPGMSNMDFTQISGIFASVFYRIRMCVCVPLHSNPQSIREP